jgi:alpha-1,3-rhamnosyl/mannosyltransferase
MRTLFNGLTALKPRTGVGQYCVRLAAELSAGRACDDLNFDVYPTPFIRTLIGRSLKAAGPGSSSRSLTLKQRFRGLVAGRLKGLGRRATALHFRRHCKRTQAELYHEPNYLPFEVDVPTVVTIHDLSVLLHPEWHPADRVRQHERRLRDAVARAAHIITDTEQVKREIVAELGVTASRVTAVPLGVGAEFAPATVQSCLQQFELPPRFWLSVGTIEPRKNLLLALRAFAALPDAIRTACPLVLAGPWGWRADAERAFFETTGRAAGVRHLGYVPDDALPALYTAAQALVYPSHYEGFGLPPLEAAACGTPTLANFNCAAVREVMGVHATWLPADDIPAWHDAFLHNFEAKPKPGLNIHRFNWTNTARQTREVYERVLHQPTSLRQAA